MVKPKKQEIGIWKTVEAKGRRKHQKEKPKPVIEELLAKSKKQNNDACRSKNSKQAKSVPKQKFYDRNRQLRSSHVNAVSIMWIIFTCAMGNLFQCALFLSTMVL